VRESPRREPPGREQDDRWGGRSCLPFLSRAADALTAEWDPGLLGHNGRQCATMPRGMAGALVQGVLRNETLEGSCPCTGHCGRSPGAGTIAQAWGALGGKARDPLAAGGRGQRERSGDGVQALPCADCTDCLSATDAPGLLCLFPYRIQRWESVIGKVELEGSPRKALSYKVRQKYTNMAPDIV